MRLFFLSFLLVALIPGQQQAQGLNTNRTVTTKIADVLAQFPADNKTQLDRNVKALLDLGEEGLTQLIQGFSAPGQGDNTSREYALQAFSSYVTSSGNEAQRKIAVQAYCKGLQGLTDDVNKEFILSQLQLVGNNDAVDCLGAYLGSPYLVSRAANALAQINSPQAAEALMKALTASSGQSAPVIEALGYLRYQPSVGIIGNTYKTTTDARLKRISGYALARIADPSSASLLSDAASKTGYGFDNTGATVHYLHYLKRLSENGNQATASKLIRKLNKKLAKDGKVHTRVAVLELLVAQQGEKGMALLQNALKDKNAQYRGAALMMAKPLQQGKSIDPWLKLLPRLAPEAKAQVISYLGGVGTGTALPKLLVESYLQDENQDIRTAAVEAVAKLGGTEAIPALLEVLKNGNAQDASAVQSALLKIKTNNIGPQLAPALGAMPGAGKAVLLEVLGARHDAAGADAAFSNFTSNDASVQAAAAKALPFVVGEQDLPRIFSLLKTAPLNNNITAVQDAAIRASAAIKDTQARAALITAQVAQAGSDREYLYFPVLADVGGKQALSALEKAYANGNAKSRAAIVQALSKATDLQSATLLLKILQQEGNTPTRKNGVDGLLNVVRSGNFPADQKVLFLQDIMPLTTEPAQKKRVLREAAANKTFLSLIFAGRFIDDPALQQDAANAIFSIGVSNESLTGDLVRNLLTKASPLLKGGDAEYQQKAIKKRLDDMAPGAGFVSMFNEKDLTGWKGLVANPIKRSQMTAKELAAAQQKADEKVPGGWQAKDGLLIFTGHGDNLATVKQYGDFEMFVDWKITADGDAGLYLRGTPQVQIWDTARRDVGAEVGSGGLYNNQQHRSTPLVVADNEVGQWNNFHIIMKGDKVTVYLNGVLVTDNVVLENYWDRKLPIFPREQIELQAHGTYVAYRNLYIKELDEAGTKYTLTDEEARENFEVLFDGTNLDKWVGDKKSYVVQNNAIVVQQAAGGNGNLFTKDEYADFIFRFEFQLTPGANNGLGIRAPLEGDAAYTGMELQILDNNAPIYKDLKPYQYHGSIYGTLAAKRGFEKPLGEWNYQEVIAKGSKIKVILNGETILDGDIQHFRDNGTPDKLNHPGLKRDKGHIGFLGHGSVVKFRNIRIKTL